jgi:hypothetical protein
MSLNQCSKYTDKNDCDLYKAWSNRNDAKKNIIQPSNIEEDIHPTKSKDLSTLVQNQEIIKFLDSHVMSDYRESYLKLKHGQKIPKQQLTKLKMHIISLMEDHKWKVENFLENEDN